MAPDLTQEPQRDYFISYAREDEDTLAKPLAAALQARGLTYWLDLKDFHPGGALEDEVHNGLLTARHGVVIISRSYLEKDWPKRELDILLALEVIDERRRIVTVRHGLLQSELVKFAPVIAQRTRISSEGGAFAVCERVIEQSRNYELQPQAEPLQTGEALFPTFHPKGIFNCSNSDCPWVPDSGVERMGLAQQGRPFTMTRQQRDWYVTCTSCNKHAFGPVKKERARWLLTFLRITIYAPTESPYLDSSLFSHSYLELVERERSLTRGGLSSIERDGSPEEWVGARDAYSKDIELAWQMGKIDQTQYAELDETHRRNTEAFSKVLADRRTRSWGNRLKVLLSPSGTAHAPESAEEEAVFPSAERDRIRRDLGTLLVLPPAVRAELSADLGERIEGFIAALTPLQARPGRPTALLYIGCLLYWNCKRISAAGTDAERVAMNSTCFETPTADLIVGYFPMAEYLLDRYRATRVVGPAEQQLLQEVESWMKAIRSQQRVNDEMRKWSQSS